MVDMPASELDWSSDIHERLSPGEWPAGTLDHISADTILLLSSARGIANCPFWPSPVPRAHVRHEYSQSQHSTHERTRLAKATDFFTRWQDAPKVLRILQSTHAGGIGIYDSLAFRGSPGDFCMFHIDTRPERLLWAGVGRDPVRYIVEAADPSAYYNAVFEMFARNL